MPAAGDDRAERTRPRRRLIEVERLRIAVDNLIIKQSKDHQQDFDNNLALEIRVKRLEAKGTSRDFADRVGIERAVIKLLT